MAKLNEYRVGQELSDTLSRSDRMQPKLLISFFVKWKYMGRKVRYPGLIYVMSVI